MKMPAYIPEDAKWYLAEVVEERKVQDEDSSLVWINFILIRADSPEEAYERSLEVGKQSEHEYQNTDDKTVTVTFRGLHNLHVIHEDLEHGNEVLYEERIGLSEREIAELIRPKTELNVFRPKYNDD